MDYVKQLSSFKSMTATRYRCRLKNPINIRLRLCFSDELEKLFIWTSRKKNTKGIKKLPEKKQNIIDSNRTYFN